MFCDILGIAIEGQGMVVNKVLSKFLSIKVFDINTLEINLTLVLPN